MKVTGRNAAVGQSAEDVISAGGTLTFPTEARKHNIVSASTEDDANGTLQQETATAEGTIVGINQIETATVVGTIAGVLQIETATVVGTIGPAGAGDVSVIVTGANVAGSPLTVPVAVANDDTAAQVAGKIRTALAIAAITDNYTVGGADAEVSLTKKVAAANDETLNISIANGTASGLTEDLTSVETQAGHAGAGNVSVIVTGALVTGSPLTVPVAVALSDNAAAVAGKIRTALGIAAITDNYTVGGADAEVSLTTKVKAANDETLNIAIANGTANGLTPDASSTNTQAGHAGSGNAQVIVTSGIVTGSPVTLNVAVVAGDTAAQWAAKVRAAINLNSAITAHYTVGGSDDEISLTAKVADPNDATLNISLDNGTCNGIVTAGTSANTTAGADGTGAWTVEISGIDHTYRVATEIVTMNGIAAVSTTKKYFYINSMRVGSAGSSGANVGAITATAQTDNTVTATIPAGRNKMDQAIYCAPVGAYQKVSNFRIEATNATPGAITTVDILTKKQGGVWVREVSIDLNSDNNAFADADSGFMPTIAPRGGFKVMATASAGSSLVNCNFDTENV